MRAVVLLVLVLVGAVGLTGCVDDDGAGAGASVARLEADRTAAGETVRELSDRLAADLAGTTHSRRGSFRGCRERFADGIAAVTYVASARVDVERAGDDLLGPVPALLRSLGYANPAATDVPGGSRWSARHRGLTVSVTTRPAQGPYLLVEVAGGCHDVPRSQQDAWVGRGADDLT